MNDDAWPVLTIALEAAGATDSEVVGAKAARLAELLRGGLRVPTGFVVTVTAFERFAGTLGALSEAAVRRAAVPEEVAAAVRTAMQQAGLLDAAVAVRSSGVAEDLPSASFAGQYESVLDVTGAEAVIEAIRRCWASAFADRVLAYRRSRALEGPPRMAVLVQRMIEAQAAGVAFSANPLTGQRDEVVVNAVRGLGERLVSGEATADEWVVCRAEAPRPVLQTENALSSQTVGAVAALAQQVEQYAGVPQDIEWALDSTGLVLLQARPITALPEQVDWQTPEPGFWLRTFRLGEWFGGPITPLFETWLLRSLEERLFSRFAKVMPAPTPRPYHVTVEGWYFTTANFVPRSVLHGVWLLARYILPAALRRPRQLSIVTVPWAHVGMRFFEAEWRGGPASQYEAAVEQALASVAAATPAALVELIEELGDRAGDEVFSFFAVGGGAWKVEAQLSAFYEKHVAPRIGGSHEVLLQGLTERRGSRAHVVLSLDWYHPTLGELAVDHDDAADSARRCEAVRVREAAQHAAVDCLKDSPRRLETFRVLVERAQHFARVREEQAAHLTLAWPVLRQAVKRLGEQLTHQGLLTAADDVFFLTRDELVAGVGGSRAAEGAELATQRRSAWQRARRLSPPLTLGTPNFIQKRIFGARPVARAAESSSERVVLGLSASRGRVVGRARVIDGPEAFSRLKAGEILVAPATTPAWTPLFARAVAVVTDTGSLMAHASLVAREYGIPAVVGTGDSTRRIRDGQMIAVDGNRGLVELDPEGLS